MSPKFMDAGVEEISSADKEKHDAGGLAGQVWNMVAEHPYASAAAVGAAALVGSRAGLGGRWQRWEKNVCSPNHRNLKALRPIYLVCCDVITPI